MKIIKQKYHDKHNALCTRLLIFSGDKYYSLPTKLAGSVKKDNKTIAYTLRVNGILYRFPVNGGEMLLAKLHNGEIYENHESLNVVF